MRKVFIKTAIGLFVILGLYYGNYARCPDLGSLRRSKEFNPGQKADLSTRLISRIVQESEIMEYIVEFLPEDFKLASALTACVVLRIAQDIPEYQNLDIVSWVASNYDLELTPQQLETIEAAAEELARDSEILNKIKSSLNTGVTAKQISILTDTFEPDISTWPDSPQSQQKTLPSQAERTSAFSLKEEEFPEKQSLNFPSCLELVSTFDAGDGKVFALTTLPDGRLVTAGDLGIIKIWDLENGRVQSIDFNWKGEVVITHLAILTDGSLVSVSSENDIYIWNLDKLEVEFIPAIKTSNDRIIAIFPDLKYATTGKNLGHRISIWDFSESSCATVRTESSNIPTVIELEDGRIASARKEWALYVWSLETRKRELLFPKDMEATAMDGGRMALEDIMGSARTLSLLLDGKIASAGEGEIMIWDLERRELITIRNPLLGEIISITSLPDGKLAVISTQGNDIKIIDLNGAR